MSEEISTNDIIHPICLPVDGIGQKENYVPIFASFFKSNDFKEIPDLLLLVPQIYCMNEFLFDSAFIRSNAVFCAQSFNDNFDTSDGALAIYPFKDNNTRRYMIGGFRIKEDISYPWTQMFLDIRAYTNWILKNILFENYRTDSSKMIKKDTKKENTVLKNKKTCRCRDDLLVDIYLYDEVTMTKSRDINICEGLLISSRYILGQSEYLYEYKDRDNLRFAAIARHSACEIQSIIFHPHIDAKMYETSIVLFKLVLPVAFSDTLSIEPVILSSNTAIIEKESLNRSCNHRSFQNEKLIIDLEPSGAIFCEVPPENCASCKFLFKLENFNGFENYALRGIFYDIHMYINIPYYYDWISNIINHH